MEKESITRLISDWLKFALKLQSPRILTLNILPLVSKMVRVASSMFCEIPLISRPPKTRLLKREYFGLKWIVLEMGSLLINERQRPSELRPVLKGRKLRRGR